MTVRGQPVSESIPAQHFPNSFDVEVALPATPGLLETTLGRSRKTVSRSALCVFGLISVVAVQYHAVSAGKRGGPYHGPGRRA